MHRGTRGAVSHAGAHQRPVDCEVVHRRYVVSTNPALRSRMREWNKNGKGRSERRVRPSTGESSEHRCLQGRPVNPPTPILSTRLRTNRGEASAASPRIRVNEARLRSGGRRGRRGLQLRVHVFWRDVVDTARGEIDDETDQSAEHNVAPDNRIRTSRWSTTRLRSRPCGTRTCAQRRARDPG
jgi:hypothetical protein